MEEAEMRGMKEAKKKKKQCDEEAEMEGLNEESLQMCHFIYGGKRGQGIL